MLKVLMLLFFVVSCGRETVVERQVPAEGGDKQPPAKGGSGYTSYSKMQGYLSTYCAKCHSTASFMTSEAGLRRSGVLGQLNSRNMPPSNGKELPEGVRTLMVNFF